MTSASQHNYPLNCSTGRWTMLSTILASSMAFIDGTALNVILPSLQSELDASATDLFWVLNSYLLMLAAFIIVGGSLGDKLGRVKIFKIGIVIFTLGSVFCGLSPGITLLIISRTVQGIGGALMIPGSLSIISAVFSKEEKGKAIGTWSAATTIVTICGPLLGGALADIGLWRYIFYINVPLGIASLIALHFKVPESLASATSKIDWWGVISLVTGLTLFTSGLLEIPDLGYDHWLVILSLFIGTLVLILFVIIEKRVNNPMIAFDIFKNRTFSGVNLLSFFLYAGLGGIMLFLSLNIIQIQGYSQFQAGMTFLPFSITMVLLARKMGQLADKHGVRKFLILGPSITGLGTLWLAFIGNTAGPGDYWSTYFPGFMVFAIGMSITVVPLTTAVMSSVEPNMSGVASGINNSVTRIAGTFINAILGATAIYLFTNLVIADVEMLNLPDNINADIMKETIKLGEAKSPEHYDDPLRGQLNAIFKNSFIVTYRWVGILCAFLAFLSAFIAFFMVELKKSNHG